MFDISGEPLLPLKSSSDKVAGRIMFSRFLITSSDCHSV